MKSTAVVNNIELLSYIDVLEIENYSLVKQIEDIKSIHRNGFGIDNS